MRKVVFTFFAALSACLFFTGCGPELNFDEGDDTGALYYTSEIAVQARVLSFYDSTAEFLNTQLEVENFICNSTWNRIGPSSREIRELWNEGNNIVQTTSLFIYELRDLNDSDIDYYKGQYITHLRVLRDFVMYNMNHLWGGIPLPREDDNPERLIPRSREDEVYLYIEEDLRDAQIEMASHPTGRWDAGKECVSERVIYMLQAECHLARKEWQPAKNLAELAANGDDGEFFILGKIPVYSKAKAQLYIKEANGETADLAASWDETFLHAYGYWATLKRLGIAQQRVMCQEYQLLLPIPYEVIYLNPEITQNPGY